MFAHVTKTDKMANDEQLSDFLTPQNISIGLLSAGSDHNNSLSAKQKNNQTINSVHRKLTTGSSTSDYNKLVEPQIETVGGVYLEDDREDEGLKSIDCTTGVSHIPRLVFIGSDEDLTQNNDYENNDSEQERNENESYQTGYDIKRSQWGESSEVTENNSESNLTSQYSRTSLHSTDSELLADHYLDDSEEIERFIIENEMTDDSLSKLLKWHCHDPATFLLPDKMARNQLIAVSILCFLFMVGEAIGKEIC